MIYRPLALVTVIGTTLLIQGGLEAQPPEQQPSAKHAAPKVSDAVKQLIEAGAEAREEALRHLRVQPGTEDEAKDYYERISKPEVLNFPFEGSSLDGLLAYMGYARPVEGMAGVFEGLVAKDLEAIASFSLMPRNDAEFAALKADVDNAQAFDALLDLADFQNDKVLVSRFFAPKIATYYDAENPFRPIDPEDIVPGWRKLVRLTARSGSPAQQAGVLHMYLLFNVKQPDPEADPFAIRSANNQVILVPTDQDSKDSAYFAVYGQGDGYPLSYFLAADFDLPGHVAVDVSGAENGKYFVPRACAECHGHSDFSGEQAMRGRPVDASGNATDDFTTGVYRFAKPNYLDTDQWYDWMEFDFRGVATSLNDVLFDGGKDHGSLDYARAVDVVFRLNTSIRDQTFAAERTPGVKTYSTLAAEKWLELHRRNDQRIPYSRRSIGATPWDPRDRDEMRLLRLLNNHCFRCHSSVIYNVFDRDAVGVRKLQIAEFLNLKVNDAQQNPLSGYRMPQGRVLRIEERDEILRLLNTVFP